GLQGRYLFPTVTCVAVVAAIGLAGMAGRFVASVMTCAALGSQAAGLWTLMGGFWRQPGSGRVETVLAALAWSWWPTALLVLAIAAVMATALTAVVYSLPRELARLTSARLPP
ncbi:MAG TPA: hypothetical protein VNA30_06910, partial [Mycobacteriales bacterium]|nr:hypothetical protein [Mycobacteriales bacterium]